MARRRTQRSLPGTGHSRPHNHPHHGLIGGFGLPGGGAPPPPPPPPAAAAAPAAAPPTATAPPAITAAFPAVGRAKYHALTPR
ncbi:MAG: hypothetical protein FJ279_23200, partial [Planctomycetes bacterium]|nr:hypothetical protein [Planctomycetota bacterium]